MGAANSVLFEICCQRINDSLGWLADAKKVPRTIDRHGLQFAVEAIEISRIRIRVIRKIRGS